MSFAYAYMLFKLMELHMSKLLASFKVGRSRHSLTAVGGSLVAAGGLSLSSVEILGQTGWSTASWSLKAPLANHCAVSFRGELVILGGDDYRKA